jgi:hypothetical protein
MSRPIPFTRTASSLKAKDVGGGDSCTVAKLVDELVAARQKAGASQFDIDDTRSRLVIFAEKFAGQPVGTITGGEIADWLRSLNVSATTRNHYQRLIVLAFNFAVQRGYMTKNPVLARFVDRPTVREYTKANHSHVEFVASYSEVAKSGTAFSLRQKKGPSELARIKMRSAATEGH